ncbi:MAG: ribosome maturation factor RimM [Rhodobacteraceae bacterium]|nr:ribosome maturation factor RimM [Paracoccaceae bacterium]
MAQAMICVGAIAGAYGVRGEVRLKSFCADPAAIADYMPLSSEDGRRSFAVTLTGQTSGALTARLDGVTSKEAADALRGTRLYVPRDRLPSLPDDEFYHADLIGLTVRDTGGRELGRVAAVLNHGATDLLEIRGPGLGDGILLPFTQTAVPTVDLAQGTIVADPPEGLIADAAGKRGPGEPA